MDARHEMPARPWLAWLLWTCTAALVAARFVHLGADFPPGVTWSGELYTDEGWYANAATRHFLTGDWYFAGDFNPVVNMPVGQLLHRAVFAVFGLSLESARLTILLSWCATLLFTALLVRRHVGNTAAALAALLLASNFTGFLYSRLAVMEPVGTAFVCAALYCADRSTRERPRAWILLAALLASAAVLTKSTLLFAVPLAAYFALRNDYPWKQRLDLLVIALLVPFFLVGFYQLGAALLFPDDYGYFNYLNVAKRGVEGPADWLLNAWHQWLDVHALGNSLVTVTLLLTVLATIASRDFRRQPLVHVMAGWLLLHFALLTLVKYGPPRYFVPMLVPLVVLATLAMTALSREFRDRGSRPALAALVFAPAVLLPAMDVPRIAAYLAHPVYSFETMARGVTEAIRHHAGTLAGVRLYADNADSIALVTGLPAANLVIGPSMVKAQIGKRPRYVLLHRNLDVYRDLFGRRGGRLVPLGTWDVFGNYHIREKHPREPREDKAIVTGTGTPVLRVFHDDRARHPLTLFAVAWGAPETYPPAPAASR